MNRKRLSQLLILLSALSFLLACSIIPQSFLDSVIGSLVAVTETLPQPTIMTTPEYPKSTSLPTLAPILPTPTLTPTQTPVVGNIWVTNWMDRAVVSFDPYTLELQVIIPIIGDPRKIITDDDAVWVIEAENNTVVRIDPATNQTVVTIPTTGFDLLEIAAGEDAVWVGVAEQVDPEKTLGQPGGVIRINPTTNEIEKYVEIGAPVASITFYDGAVWVAASTGIFSTVNRIDPATNMVTSKGDYSLWDGTIQIAANEAGLWLINSAMNFVHHIDPVKDELIASVDIAKVPGTPYKCIASDSDVWVLFDNGNVARIDQSRYEIFAIIPVSIHANEIFLYAGDVWAVSQAEASLYLIDVAQNRVIAEALTGSISPTPTPIPTATKSAWEACQDTYDTRLNIGMKARVTDYPFMNNRLRSEPNAEATIIGYIPPGGQLEILEGPSCANNWIWWRVRYLVTGQEGWTSEGDGTDYWLEPVD